MSFRRVLQLSLAVLFGSLVLALASPAGAVDNPDYTSPPPTTVVTTPGQPDTVVQREVATASSSAPVRSQLAITGSDAVQTAVLGGGLVLVGVGVLALRRRHVLA